MVHMIMSYMSYVCMGAYNYHVCSTSELASGIVSTALQCGTGRCPTDDLQLNTPVMITIEHSNTVKV